MTFLRADRNPETSWFWEVLAREHSGASAALQELARGDSSVVCDPGRSGRSCELGAMTQRLAQRARPGLDRHVVGALPGLRATADVMVDVLHAIASQRA